MIGVLVCIRLVFYIDLVFVFICFERMRPVRRRLDSRSSFSLPYILSGGVEPGPSRRCASGSEVSLITGHGLLW